MAMVQRKPIVITLLFLGFAFLVFCVWLPGMEGQWAWALAAIIIGAVPPVHDLLVKLLNRIRCPSPRARFRAALIIWALASSYFCATAAYQGRTLFPRSHDEQMHFVQMQMMAHGRLWESMDPQVADFFESFFILTRPVYAAIYFPGTSLLYLPTIWLHLPTWLLPICVSGAIVAMAYRVLSEIIDGVAGAAAAFMLISLQTFRLVSTGVMSHTVMALQGLILIWAWMRWREKPSLKWAAIIGALGGWMAITRPLDAIAYAAPVGIAMLVALVKQRPSKLFATIGIIFAAAIPFLSLQAILDWGTTGNILKTPYQIYLDADQPNSAYGFHPLDPDARPKTKLAQKQMYYRGFLLPKISVHTPQNIIRALRSYRMPITLNLNLPSPLLLVLIPLSIAGLTTVPRIVMFSVLPLYLLLYIPNPQFLEHYVVVVAPIVVFIACLGAYSLWQTWAGRNFQFRTILVLTIVSLALTCFPEINAEVRDEVLQTPLLRFKRYEAPNQIQKPAVVLFHYEYTPGNLKLVHEEPVYNIDAPRPDDAPIIYAHDLGPRHNVDIFRYYAERQPQRRFYLIDRAAVATSPKVIYLGTAQELAKQ